MARVLVVDDSPDIRNLVTAFLTSSEHEVRTAADGAAALAHVDQETPDLMVLDILMPEVDGFEVLQKLRQRKLGDMKILILTAKTAEGDIVRGYRLGADHYLTKPFTADELNSALDDVLSTSKAALRARAAQELDKAQLLARLESMFGDS